MSDGSATHTELVKQGKDRSTIAFPYMDLESAESVATMIHQKFGDSGHLDTLADALGHAGIKSGAFQMKMSAARTFGLVETDRLAVTLTALGQRIVQPHLRSQARVEAFLTVPLYNKIFEEYRGRQLPPDEGLQSRFKTLGVAPKQVEKARQTFRRSAEQAGMMSASKDKLILPAIASMPSNLPTDVGHDLTETTYSSPSVSPATGVDLSKHPAISSFLLTMPADSWSAEDIEEWIDHFKGVVMTVYKVKTPQVKRT
ncbi:MAG: hypothetical protein GC165_20620 [Armatimonadetes bacterium]|nr:hypothetical protein [Armatimonadota bacterium]